ncbi:TonB-dependent receptor [Sphingobacteriales bacterium UPWRP_1]|nr:hypothetical protein BVG80_09945 [Sphingobacteriales bacterium TSM_CSM]PSJ74518.1 TonB-dependent receptor [Sphingobacteriales bacterium UPWRP_1]
MHRLTSILPLTLLLLLCYTATKGQTCTYTISGELKDRGSNTPLPYATVYIQETQSGTVADSLGQFTIPGVCAGDYHLKFSHIGCDTENYFLQLTADTILVVFMAHHTELLNETIIHGKREDNVTSVSNTIGRRDIVTQSSKSLAGVLENIAGVSVLKNGSGISKPVVHGLYGNRIAILNNGIAQAGQQWGNDHAPEIDPFAADHISVVKGAAALAYGANALGSVVLVEMDNIQSDPHLHGEINYLFQLNGLGSVLNARCEKAAKWASWRMSATLNARGDLKSPHYYLTNTGKREANVSAQLEKKIGEKINTKLYYSLFTTETGILRGSHIGNLTDLENAINRSIPFFTRNSFSYGIEAPRQTVQHHLLKAEVNRLLKEGNTLQFIYGGQLNNRKEFDVRRSGRENIPALSLLQQSHYAEGIYKTIFGTNLLLKSGIQFNYTDNSNNPETGVLPLIPDYRAYSAAWFVILQKEFKKLSYEFGARYSLRQLNAVTISTTLPRKIERFYHLFHNYTLSGAVKYLPAANHKITLDAGYMLRPPEVNELYSAGLHQGVSGIEEGNRNLQEEKSVKILLADDFSVNNKLFVQALTYYQFIRNFIYLQPLQEYRLTIRGAFPLFVYRQTDATLWGADLMVTYKPTDRLKFQLKYAIVRGRNAAQHIPLVNMPADNLFASAMYAFPDVGRSKNNTISFNGRYVWKQTRLLPEQDFLPPPNSYFLLGATAGTQLGFKESELHLTLSAENILNTVYRDYLNRQRYFANEPGIAIELKAGYIF